MKGENKTGARLAVGLLVALVAMLALASSAMAGINGIAGDSRLHNGPNDPYTSNVPYLAWNGEQIRLVKCFAGLPDVADSDVELFVEDWSGDPFFKPNIEQSTVADFVGTGERRGDRCVRGSIVSLKPGLAVVKLVVSPNGGAAGDRVPVLKHQFLVIWLTLGNPTIIELPFGGDPDASGNFRAPFSNGRVQISVKGSFPLGNNFAGLIGDANADTVTLPDQWAQLANLLSVDGADAQNDAPGTAPYRWDIHDDMSTRSLHAGDNPCTPRNPAGIDAVDNCGSATNSIDGPYSSIYGLSGSAIGPFDPSRPLATLLSDGKLDEDDAPMPAARVDVRIAANSGGPGDISGAGALVEVLKSNVYDRGPLADHRYYAPFYARYLPATEEGSAEASGNSGPRHGNNYAGYLDGGRLENDAYVYWRFAEVFEGRRGANDCRDELGAVRPRPAGPSNVAIYTDEHGEAMIDYAPNTGFFFAADQNGLCDLGETPGRLIGSSVIQAEAKYPYQPVFEARKLSNTLTKNVFSGASKALDCYPKSDFVAVCVETIRDIEGDLVEGAEVCFTREPRGDLSTFFRLATFEGVVVDTRTSDLVSQTENRICVATGVNGQAAVEVISTLNGLVDVKAENAGTRNGGVGIIRARCVRFQPGAGLLPTDTARCPLDSAGTTGTTGGSTTGGSTTGGSTTGGSTTGGSTTGGTTTGGSTTGGSTTGGTTTGGTTGAAAAAQGTVVSVNGSTKVEVKAPAKVAKASIASARLVITKAGRVLVVKVNGASKTAKLRITLVGKNGKVVGTAIRTVKTGTLAKVQNLRISKIVRTVRVSVL